MAALAVLVLVGASASAAQGSGDDDATSTRLIGYQEVPSISTVGVGTFRVRMMSDTHSRSGSPTTGSSRPSRSRTSTSARGT